MKQEKTYFFDQMLKKLKKRAYFLKMVNSLLFVCIFVMRYNITASRSLKYNLPLSNVQKNGRLPGNVQKSGRLQGT
jgi:hypothetical protein